MTEREYYSRYGDLYAIASSEFRRVKICKGNDEIELESVEVDGFADWLREEAFKS
jgi:hypothetical protein